MNDQPPATDALASKLPDSHQRFLSKTISTTLAIGVVRNAHLYELFPPRTLFAAIESEMELREKLFELTPLGARHAAGFDVTVSATILEQAVKLGDTSDDHIFRVFDSDVMVRTLDVKALFALAKNHGLKATEETQRLLLANLFREMKAEMLYGDLVKTLHAIESVLGFEAYVEHLPKPVLVQALKQARLIADGKPGVTVGGMPFGADALAEVVTTDLLVKHLPLELLWQMPDALALKFGWVDPPKEEPKPEPPKVAVPPPANGLPAEALDSQAPPAPPEDAKPTDEGKKSEGDDGDPEVSVAALGSGGALELDVDEDVVDDEDDKPDGKSDDSERPSRSSGPPSLPAQAAPGGRPQRGSRQRR